MTPGARFTIGNFEVDPARNVVLTAAGEAPLEPKIMDVLCLLASHAGEVLSRERIIDAVWGHAFGADESLTRAISHLRKVFGDARSPAQVIETISKRGYRLIAPVSFEREVSMPPGKARWRWAVAAVAVALLLGGALYHFAVRPPSSGRAAGGDGIGVVVQPFDPLEAGDAIASRTVADQVAVALSRASLLHIGKDGAAVMQDGGLAYDIRGTVQHRGATVRVTVKLNDARSGESVWAGLFDRAAPLDPAAQDELVGAIAGELNGRLLNAAKTAIRRRPLTSLRPWELTLLATWVPGSDEVFLRPHAADSLWPQQRALELDPNYAPAHASLASALAYRALFMPGAKVARLRREAARHAEIAKALAPYDVGVLYELATYYRLVGDRAGAQVTLQHVLAIQSDHPVARYDLPFIDGQCSDRGGTAIGQLDAALRRLAPDNPVRWVILSHLADLHLARGEFKAAADLAGQSRAIVRMTWSGVTLAAAQAAQGKTAEALRVSRETKLEWPGLDWDRFAATMTPVWCMGGSQQAPAAAAFRRLAAIERAGH